MGKVKEKMLLEDTPEDYYTVVISRFSDPKGAAEVLFTTNDYVKASKVAKNFLRGYRAALSGDGDIYVAISYDGLTDMIRID